MIVGMFDTITCEMPLPGPGDKNTEFQTKSFESKLAQLVILRSGAIIEICNECKQNIYLHQHNSIIFYTYINDIWVQYIATINNSHVVNIKLDIELSKNLL